MKKRLMKWTMVLLSGVFVLAACDFDYDDTKIWERVNDLESRVTNLESMVSAFNSQIAQLRQLVNTAESNSGTTIKSVTPIENGYQIKLSDGSVLNLNNGQNGQDGQDGQTPYVGDNGNWWIGNTDTGYTAIGRDGQDGRDGQNGQDGKDGQDGRDGADGQTPYIGSNGNWWIGTSDTGQTAIPQVADVPIIGVKEFEGRYYWTRTINGQTEFLTDNQGNKLPVSGGDSTKPLLRVDVQDFWRISYDGGITYEFIYDNYGTPIKHNANGGTSGESCHCVSFFQSVSYSNGILILILTDGQVVRIDTNNGGGGSDRIDPRLDNVVPDSVQDNIEQHMPLYDGINPPIVEGVYLIAPMVAVYCEDGTYQPGHEVIETVIKLSNQDTTNNTLDYDDYEGTINSNSGHGAFISGSGDNFTAYFNNIGVSYGDTNTKTALVISGTKTPSGIKDLYYAFVMVEKDGPSVDRLMDEGIFRIFKDNDGLSENTTWNPSSSARATDSTGLPATQWGIYSATKK